MPAKYQDKKKIKTEKGESTIYEYGPRQIANRHKEKADQVEKMSKVHGDLVAKVMKDLTAKDPDTRATALAIALMDETYERVGNDESADQGHFGVTGWKVKHVTMSKDSATVSYVGKSGVSHKKKVTNAKIVSALREALKDKKPEDSLTGDIGAKDVNQYLKNFGVTAKDVRGYHANDEMRSRLKAIRSKGPSLPAGRKEKDAILKKEFEKALEETSSAVGHESATLRKQYLVPGLEDNYLHDGSISSKFNDKEASIRMERIALRVAALWIAQ